MPGVTGSSPVSSTISDAGLQHAPRFFLAGAQVAPIEVAVRTAPARTGADSTSSTIETDVSWTSCTFTAAGGDVLVIGSITELQLPNTDEATNNVRRETFLYRGTVLFMR